MTKADNHKQSSGNPLGKAVEYSELYQPSLLFAIERSSKRLELGIQKQLPFQGEDIWNAYEVSWLNSKGLPRVAIAEFRIPANSPFIVESKSFKLYLNSLNQKQFATIEEFKALLIADLENVCKSRVAIELYAVQDNQSHLVSEIEAVCIDDLDVSIEKYDYSAEILSLSQAQTDACPLVSEKLCSHLLKSNCLITNQPDWASVYIDYRGEPIDHKRLLAYLVSFRNHNEFHEQCVERIFTDIMNQCKPKELTVYARYTRRGGLDINPWRSNNVTSVANTRLVRQ